MAENTEKSEDLAVIEGQDGSATVDLPENLLSDEGEEGENASERAEGGSVDDDADQPGDSDELRAAKRNKRRAKKDLIRKTNQEKDIRLVQLQRENEEFKRRLWELSRMPATRLAARDLLRTMQARKAELGEVTPQTILPTSAHADMIGVLVAGGPGTHSIYVPSFGNTRAVTREIVAAG